MSLKRPDPLTAEEEGPHRHRIPHRSPRSSFQKHKTKTTHKYRTNARLPIVFIGKSKKDTKFRSSIGSGPSMAGYCFWNLPFALYTEPTNHSVLMLSSDRLRRMIYTELTESGFRFKRNAIVPPDLRDKSALRKVHKSALEHLLVENRKCILENENKLLEFFADGNDVVPEEISPKLVLIEDASSENTELFRYASYLWSIPLSRGFGRRLRYLVMDESNELFYSNLSPDCWTLPGCSGRGRIAGITPSGVYSVKPSQSSAVRRYTSTEIN